MNIFEKITRMVLRLAASLFLGLIVFGLIGAALLYHPDTPVPQNWNPIHSLDPRADQTPLTKWKLRRALATPETCYAALIKGGAKFKPLPNRETSNVCHIKQRTNLSKLGTSTLSPVETRCSTALRLLMWEHHSVQPSAQEHLGQAVTRTHHFSSYSCRKIRGSSTWMSQHATANAIDISAFTLADKSQISLKRHWSGAGPKSEFLHQIRRGGCTWFNTTLSPDYNAAHHDHFHFDMGRWRACR